MDLYNFTSENEQIRFNHIAKTLRCTVCQNQSLYDSHAPQALDLKKIIAHKIKAGEQDPDIYNYLSSRYGEFILYAPNFTSYNIILWGFPFIALFLVLISLFNNFFKKN